MAVTGIVDRLSTPSLRVVIPSAADGDVPRMRLIGGFTEASRLYGKGGYGRIRLGPLEIDGGADTNLEHIALDLGLVTHEGDISTATAVSARVDASSRELELRISDADASNALALAGQMRNAPPRHSAQRLLVEAGIYLLLMKYFDIDAALCVDAPGTNKVVRSSAAGRWSQFRTESERVLAIQSLLTRLGFEPGPVDGIWGVRSQHAARVFETERKLPPNGEPTSRLFLDLELAVHTAKTASGNSKAQSAAELPNGVGTTCRRGLR